MLRIIGTGPTAIPDYRLRTSSGRSWTFSANGLTQYFR